MRQKQYRRALPRGPLSAHRLPSPPLINSPPPVASWVKRRVCDRRSAGGADPDTPVCCDSSTARRATAQRTKIRLSCVSATDLYFAAIRFENVFLFYFWKKALCSAVTHSGGNSSATNTTKRKRRLQGRLGVNSRFSSSPFKERLPAGFTQPQLQTAAGKHHSGEHYSPPN